MDHVYFKDHLYSEITLTASISFSRELKELMSDVSVSYSQGLISFVEISMFICFH